MNKQINPTEPYDVYKFLEENSVCLTHKKPCILTIKSSQNTFNGNFSVRADFEKEIVGKSEITEIYNIRVYPFKETYFNSFLEFKFEIITSKAHKFSNVKKNIDELPSVEKDKVVTAILYTDNMDQTIVYTENGIYNKTFVSDEDYITKGFEVTKDTIKFYDSTDYEEYICSLPISYNHFLDSVKEMLEDFGYETPEDDKILEIINGDDLKTLLIGEDLESITDTYPRDYILEKFDEYRD